MRVEKTKNKVKMRKSTRNFCLAVASILFAISSVTLFGSFLGIHIQTNLDMNIK